MLGQHDRPEFSKLADFGDWVWARVINPILVTALGGDDLTSLRRVRGAIQLTVLASALLLPVALILHSGRIVNASGLLFDIAGALRLFLLDEVDHMLSSEVPNEYGNYSSAVTRELIHPEGTSQSSVNDDHVSFFYYKKRGVLFLFIGFVLQMIADIFG